MADDKPLHKQDTLSLAQLSNVVGEAVHKGYLFT